MKNLIERIFADSEETQGATNVALLVIAIFIFYALIRIILS